MEQTCMLTKLSLAAGLVLAAATLAPAASAAAPQSPIPAVFAADGGLIQKAQWGWGYGRCHAWRRECAALGLAYGLLLPPGAAWLLSHVGPLAMARHGCMAHVLLVQWGGRPRHGPRAWTPDLATFDFDEF